MGLKLTDEQKKFFKYVHKRTENILLNAKAGSGKTTTLLKSLELLPKGKSILFLAFNKHIQKELKEKLPENIRCYTSHGLGMSALKRKYGDKIVFDEFKLDKCIQKKSKNWNLENEFEDLEAISNYLNDVKKIVNLCRQSLTTNKKYIPFLAERHDLIFHKEKDLSRVLKVLDTMTRDRKTFDYTDMVYLPAIDNSIWFFPQDYIYVDEAQDVTRAQQRIIEKSLKKDKVTKKIKGRLISCGDNFQSIYGFATSDERTYDWFRNFPNTKELYLTYTFRCAKNIVEHAQKIVPEIKALPDAPEGIVREGNVLEETKDGDFVLCRTTTPLVKLFFELLSKKKKVIIKGSDIGISIIELIGDFKSIDKLISHWEKELRKYKEDLKKQGILNPTEHSGYMSLEDKINTLVFLAKASPTIPDLKNNITTIFTDKLSGIVLSTIHKSKGLESDRVFIIRPDKIPLPNTKGWQYAQEKNLEYVAITRAKNELIYDYQWTDE